MQTLGQQLKATPKQTPAINPFAQALAEREKNTYGNDAGSKQPDALTEAFAKTGGQGFDSNFASQNPNSQPNLQENFAKQQEDLLAKQKKDALRKKLHDQINPVNQVDIFSAREQRVNKEIEEVRKELKLLSVEIAKLHKEVDIAVTQEVVNPGQEGQYYFNFFAQLRRFIMMLRSKVKSARTWAKQMHAKKRKKRGPTLEFAGSKKAETVHTILDNNELNNAYSGD